MSKPQTFSWDAKSAGRKLVSGIEVKTSVKAPIPVPFVGVKIEKKFPITDKLDKQKDAYRNCKNCGRHINYHGEKGECPKCKK